jgi:hypothetical protein
MLASLNIVDNIFPEPQSLREFLLSEHDFSEAPEFEGRKYPGFTPIKDPRFAQFLAQRVGAAIGANVLPQMVLLAAGTEGFETQQWIHCDTTCASFAGVIYMFDKPGYGTQFWRHALGAETLPEFTKQREGEDPEATAVMLQEHGRSQEWWEKTDYADSKFNRLIFFPTNRFHSRWPKTAFGDKPENCRLIITFFFDIVQ